MSFFDDLNAVSEVKKIKAGGVGKLSISQVANLIVNLPDAKRNLDQRQYKEKMLLINFENAKQNIRWMPKNMFPVVKK